MEISSLKTVVLVAQQGSFAAAARVLNVDPSSVSRAVASVEAELGIRLFQRTTRALRITEEGEAYLNRLEPLLDALDHAHDAARQSVEAPKGTLRMTTSVAFAHECVVPALPRFRERYPDIAVELTPTDANLDIAANGLDLAIRLTPRPVGDLVATRLMATRYRVCAAPDYLARQGPLQDPSALSGHDCLRFALPEYRTRWRFRQGSDAPFDVAVSGTIVIANALALRRAAVDGLGPALLADWLVASDLARGTLVDVFPQHECTATTFETGAWALYPSRSYLPRKVRVMIDHLREHLRGARA